ncbi:ADP-ribosyltransferase [Kitasatospora sp. NPDC004799]|uniref:scabin-related ADP-ribosyltransferase n=1 Tax=Kitasatospora sp. NPDC004799 TaxID=3154460 RepID=UPI0033AF0346
MLPPGLAKFFGIVTGMKWPEADEDKLRTAGDDYLVIHQKVPELRGYLVELVKLCNESFEGEAADAFMQKMRELIGETGGTDFVTAAGHMAKQLGDFAHKVANQVEYAKWMIIAQLIQLVAQIAWAIAMSPITFGGSLAEIFVAYETAGAVIKQVFIWLFKQLLLHEFLSITTAVVMDGIIQGIQIGKGHKDHWEKESFIQAVEMGAINGLLTGPLELLTFGLGKAFGRVFGRGLSKELQADLKALAGSEFKDLLKNELKSMSGAELKEFFNILRRSESKIGGKEAVDQARAKVAKDLEKRLTGAEAGRHSLKELTEQLKKEYPASAGKGIENVVRKEKNNALSELAKEVGERVENPTGLVGQGIEHVAEHLSKVERLALDMGRTFERELVELGVDRELSGAAGRLIAERLAAAGGRYAVDLGTVNKLVSTLVAASGRMESGTLRAELQGVTKQISHMQGELKQLSGGALESGLKDLKFLQAEQQHLRETIKATQDLAGRAVSLMDGLHPQTAGQFLYRFGEGIGNYLKGGVQNVVSEGAYNLTFGENHEFTVSVESFYGGVAMGALGHLGHIAGGPLRLKLSDIELPNYARFPLAVVSNLMGHPTSLWVSRPEGAGGAPHVTGLPEGTRPEHLKLDSDGSPAPSGDKPARPTANTPAEPPVKVTGGDGGPKAPSEPSKASSDTSRPEPPKQSSTVGGPKEEPRRTTVEETTETVPAPVHATTTSSDVPPPAHAPGTGQHGERPQEQRPQPTGDGDRTVPQHPDPKNPQPQHPDPQNPQPTGHRDPAEPGGTERLQYLDVGDDSHVPPTTGHFLSGTGADRQPGWVAGEAEPSPHVLEVLEKLPVDPTRYTVVIHTDGSGAPMPPGELASVVRGLASLGHLSGDRRTIEFVSCGLDGATGQGYVRQVMEQVWLNPKLADLKAVAADGPVWVAPRFSGKSVVEGPGTGHVIVASNVGFNADGRPTVVGGGAWHTYARPSDGGEPVVTRTESQVPTGYEHQPTGEVRPMDAAMVFGPDPEPKAYHYTDAPEHIRAEADGVRAEQWRRTQRDLQDQYEAKLSEAAEELRTDPDGSGHRREEEAERLLDEALDAPGRFPEDAPADLRGAVHERARAMMYEELAARPEERQRILGDLDGLVRVAAVREAAVRVAVQHFDRTVAAGDAPRITDGATGVAHTPERPPASVVELVRQDFRARADAEAARIYADADSLTTEANTRAGQALRRLTEHARAELLLETDRANALAEVEQRVEQAAGDWYDRLSPTDREMLAAVGVTERVDLSPSSLRAIRERLQERAGEDYDQAAGPRDEATGRRRGHDEVRELYARSQAENPSALPHEFAVQAAREAAINRAVAEAEKAADSWAEDLARKEFAEKFGADESDVLRAKDTVLRELAGEMDRAATERFGEPAAVRAALDRLTDPAALHDRLTHQAARLAVRRQATAEAQAAAREHGLSPHAADRLTEGHGDRIARAFDESFRSHEDLAGRQEHWQNTRDELVRELREHAAFEREAAPALREAAKGFDGLAARHTLNEALTDHLKREYGDDFVARYRELWTLDHFDAAGWNAHQRTHEDAFGRGAAGEAPDAPDTRDAGRQDHQAPPSSPTLAAPPATGQDGQVVAARPPVGLGGGEMPVPGPLHEWVQALDYLSPEERRQLASEEAYLTGLREELEPGDFAQAAVRLLIEVDPRTHQPVAARRTAEDLLARMLTDKVVAERLVASGARVVVVPRDVPMTDVPGFVASGHGTGDGRDWAVVRGASGHGLVLITEENLLGSRTSVGPDPAHAEGYSTSVHELAHAIHEFGLTEAQRGLIEEAFRERSDADALTGLFGEEDVTAWPDGGLRDGNGDRVGNYSARDEHEFFAQLVTAYFGYNHGNDPVTGLARNNGVDWVRENVPELVPLLEHLFGTDPRADHPEPANPVARTDAEEQLFHDFREFMRSAERESRLAQRPGEEELFGRFREFMRTAERETRVAQRPGEEELFGRFRAFMESVEGESRPAVRPGEDELLDGYRTFMESATRTDGRPEDDAAVLQPGEVVTEANGTQLTVLGPVLPTRPTRIDEHGLAASDVLIGLDATRTRLLDHFASRFAEVLHGEEAAARTLAETLFGAETLQAKLTALSRGEVWDVPFAVGTWSGTVRVGADLGRSTFVRAADDFEFEYGSERQTAVGVTGDRLLQVNVGAQAKFKFGKPAELIETVGYQRDWQHGKTDAQASRMLARGKTSETAALFDTVFRLKAEFVDLGRRTLGVFGEVTAPPFPSVEVRAQVAVPLRETGVRPEAPLPLLPPPGAGPGGGRLSGSHVVTDVWALPHTPRPTAGPEGVQLVDLGAPVAAKGMAGFVAGFEAQAREHFGSTWPALKARLLEQVDLGTLHQDLKALMSGETRTVEVDSLLGPKAVITLRNARIHTIEPTAELPPTEFNIATGTARSHVAQDTTGKGWQFPLVGSGTGSAKNGGGGAGAGVRTGREQAVLTGGGDELSLGTKVKTAGVVFEGEARIEVEFGAFGTARRTPARSVDAGLGFRVVVDRAETSPATPGQPNPVPHPDHAPLPPGALVPHPPTGIWHGSAAYTGLPETTVVRDVRSVAPLHARLDEIGRARLGEKAWGEVREDVLRAFSQSAVGAHLVGMTQEVPLRSPAVELGPLSKLGIGVTAHVTALTYRREQASADLNPVRENTTFESKRLLASDTWTVSAQGFGKGPVRTREDAPDESGKPFTDTLQGTASVTREVRDRDGWRGGATAKSYASGKYRSAQVLYDARFELQLTVNGKPHGEPVPLEAALSMEQAHTRPLARTSRVIGNPFDGAAPPLADHPQPQNAGQPPANLRVPDRLGHSDVVLGVGRRGASVLDEVQRVLGTVGPVSARASARLAAQLDGAGLTASLSRLSRGGTLRVAVDTGHWKGTVEVTVAPLALRHRRTVEGFEFELGSQQRTVVGYSWDRLNRWRFGAALKGTVPHVTVTGDYARTRDSVRGLTVERTGGTGSRGKSVETAELFDGDAVFTVRFVPDRFQRALPGTTTPAPVLVAAPHREVVLTPAGHQPAAHQLPDQRLGSSDIVTRVYLDGGNGTALTGPQAVARAVAELQPKGRAALGRDWEGMRTKLLDALDFDKLHPLLKPMTSGHEIVLTHGRSTVRITASVDGVTRSGDAPQVEFNIGASTQTAVTSSDAGPNTGSGHADALGLTVLGTLGTGVSPVLGGGVTHTRREDALEYRRDVVTTGTAVKTKLAAEAHRAVIRLSVVMERRPAVPLGLETRPVVPAAATGTARSGLSEVAHRLAGAGHAVVPQWRLRRTVAETLVHADLLTEPGRTAPDAKGPGQRRGPAPAQELRVPPAEVFTSGLRPGDVLRWVGDTGGLRDLLRTEGPRFFGGTAWKRLEPVVSGGLSHAQLSALLTPAIGAHQGEGAGAGSLRAVGTPSVSRRWFVDDVEVTVKASLVQLEYQGDSARAALSPANESGGGGRSTRLTGRQWNLRGQFGAQADVGGPVEGTGSVLVGGTHGQRLGTVTDAGGRTVANAKANTPMARYTGHVQLELTFRKGGDPAEQGSGTERSLSGLVPLELEIPHADTKPGVSPADHWTQFTPEHPDGQAVPRQPVGVQVAHALAPHHDGGVHVLRDPLADRATSENLERSVGPLQDDPRYFTLAYHSVTEDGAPGWNGRPLHPADLADALAELHAAGTWDGRPLRFVACDAQEYVTRVLLSLRERLPGVELEAYAANGKLWVVPDQGRTHLVVAQRVGWDAAGRPRLEAGGQWQHLRLPVAEAGGQQPPADPGAGVQAPQPQPHGAPQPQAAPVVEVVGAHGPQLHDPSPLAEATPTHPITDQRDLQPLGTPRQALHATPEHRTRAEEFEARLGAYAFAHPQARAAARNAVERLYEALVAANPGTPEGELYKVFLNNDRKPEQGSAGQVGEQLSLEEFRTLMRTGNTRELLTAFYNAAYVKDSPLGLKQVLQRLLDAPEAEAEARAAAMKLDLRALKEQADFIRSGARSVLEMVPGLNTMFAKDHFGTGTVIKQGAEPFKAGKEYLESLKARQERDPAPPNDLTAQGLQDRGMPLSDRELAYQQSVGDGVVLTWKPGRAHFALNEKSAWFGEAHHEKGMPLSTGISATTAKMLNAFRLLKVEGSTPQDMLLALVGWMLPLGDHSLYEILKGAQLLGELPPVPLNALSDVSVLYQHIPGIPQEVVRTALGEDGMLPHEAAYHSLLRKPRSEGGWRDEVVGNSQRNRDGFVTAANDSTRASDVVSAWLLRNPMTAQEVLDRVTPAHFDALAVYTGAAYPLINVALRFGPLTRRKALEYQISQLLESPDPNRLPTILRRDPVLDPLLAKLPRDRTAQDRKDLAKAVKERLPQIERELLAHAELISEALDKLPPYAGDLWRGDRVVGRPGGVARRLSPSFGGDTFTNPDFVSTSTEERTAMMFMQTRKELPFTYRALLHFSLSGGGSAFDIQPFSDKQGEAEVLIRPGSTFDLGERLNRESAARESFVQIEATERVAPPPFPKTEDADLRLHAALAKLANVPELRTHDDLWPLAQYIGADHVRPFADRVTDLVSGEAARREASMNAWRTAKLAQELQRGTEGITLQHLTELRRTADVVRAALGLPADHQVTVENLAAYVRRLKGQTGGTVGADELRALIDTVDRLKRPGHAVTPIEVERGWRDPGYEPDPGLTELASSTLYWVGDRHADWRTLTESVFPHLPRANDFLNLAMHTTEGVPVLGHVVVAPADIADGLLKLHEEGGWDGVKPVRFIACDLNVQPDRSYVREVMEHVWARLPEAVAYAADGRVWFVPPVAGAGGAPGHLVVTSHVGMDAQGRPRIVQGGSWFKLTATRTENVGAYLDGDGSTAYPQEAPDAVHGEIAGAVKFATDTTLDQLPHTDDGPAHTDDGSAHTDDGPSSAVPPDEGQGPTPPPGSEALAPSGAQPPPTAVAVRHAVFDEPRYRQHAEDFERALGEWTASDPRVLARAREALRRIAEETGAQGTADLVAGGSLHEVMREFHRLAGDERFGAGRPEAPEGGPALHPDPRERGLRTVGGTASHAAAVAVHAYRLLGQGDHDLFARALYGWLLPGGEHALHEVVAGMRLGGAFPGHRYEDGAGLYRDVPGVPPAELRPPVENWDGPVRPAFDHPAPESLTAGLPHERTYLEWAATSREVTGEVLAEAHARWEALTGTDPQSGLGAPPYLAWMARNGVTRATDVTDLLGPAHFAALYTYTGPAYSLINVLLEHQGADPVPALRGKIAALIAKSYRNPGTALPRSITELPELREGMRAKAQPWSLAESLTDRQLSDIQREMALHSHLLADALALLPAARGTLYRGDGTLEDPMRPTGRPGGSGYGGDVIRTRTFASFSTDEATSLGFMKRYDGEDEHRVLLELEATGLHGRDIAAFSSHMEEDEVLFLPGARIEVVERTLTSTEDGVGYVRLRARETASEETDNTAPATAPQRTGAGPDLTGQLLGHTITDGTGRETGQAHFDEADWSKRSALYPELSEFTTFVPRSADGFATGAPQQVPWDGKHTYFFAAHAGPDGFVLPLADGTKAHGVTGTEVGALLKRRLADLALKAADAQVDAHVDAPADARTDAAGGPARRPASITLLGCESAEHAQAVARQTGLPVHAPTGRTGVSGSPAGPDSPSTASLYVKSGPDGSPGRFRTFHPDGPGDTGGGTPPPSGPGAGRAGGPAAPTERALDNTGEGEEASPSGPQIVEYPTGERIEYYPDGLQVHHLADRVVEYYPDGVEVEHYPGGRQVHRLADRVVDYRADGMVVEHHPDGRQDTYDPERRLVERYRPSADHDDHGPGIRPLDTLLAERNVVRDPDTGEPRLPYVPTDEVPHVALWRPERPVATEEHVDLTALEEVQSVPLLWRHDQGHLYRWERQRSGLVDYPEIFETGLWPRQANRHPDLQDYVGSNEESSLVSTTRSRTAQHVDWGTWYRYVIDAPGGIDVRETLNRPGLSEEEQEVAFPGGVDGRYIVGVELVRGTELDGATGRYTETVEFIPNEGYWPAHRPTEQIETMQPPRPGSEPGSETGEHPADHAADHSADESADSADESADQWSDHSADDIESVLNGLGGLSVRNAADDSAVGSDTDNSAVPPGGGHPLVLDQTDPAVWADPATWAHFGVGGAQAAELFWHHGGWTMDTAEFDAMPRAFRERLAQLELFGPDHERHARDAHYDGPGLEPMAELVRGLSAAEQQALEFYTAPSETGDGEVAEQFSYFEVKQTRWQLTAQGLDHTALPPGAMRHVIEQLDNAIEQSPVTGDLVVSRGAPYVGQGLHPDTLRVDQVVVEPTYVSVSAGSRLHGAFGQRLIRLYLMLPDRTPGAFLREVSHSPAENEILLGAGLRWWPVRIIPPEHPLPGPLDGGEADVPPESQWIVYGRVEAPYHSDGDSDAMEDVSGAPFAPNPDYGLPAD